MENTLYYNAHPVDAAAGEDAAYKSADSDALKRAAMAFGVGLAQLYLERGRRSGARPRELRGVRSQGNAL